MVLRLATGGTGYRSAPSNWALLWYWPFAPGSEKTIGCAVTLDSLESEIICCNICLEGQEKLKAKFH